MVSEADGYQPHLIAPEQGYRRLIEGSLNYFRGPAEASVDAVSIRCLYWLSNSLRMCSQLYLSGDSIACFGNYLILLG